MSQNNVDGSVEAHKRSQLPSSNWEYGKVKGESTSN